MQILGIESSSLVASVAIWDESNVIAEYTVNFQKTHSQTLLPMLDEIVSMIDYDLSRADAIAISNGPGSFTGLRIGSATAKGLGLALKKPIVEVPTVSAMAFAAFGFDGVVCPIMDARRNQVYTGLYRFAALGEDEERKIDSKHIVVDNYCFETIMDPCAMSVDELMQLLNGQEERVLLLGDGVPVYRSHMQEMQKKRADGRSHLVFAPQYMSRQRGGVLATLAALYYQNGLCTVDAGTSGPDYLRKSQAEREMDEKMQQAKQGETR